MKASELDKGLRIVPDPDDDERAYYIPPQRIPVYEAFKKVGQMFDRSIHDRTWDWWVNIVTAEPVSKQDIKMVIPQLYRTKDASGTGKEWIYYNLEMSANDWKGNRKDWTTKNHWMELKKPRGNHGKFTMMKLLL